MCGTLASYLSPGLLTLKMDATILIFICSVLKSLLLHYTQSVERNE